MGGVTFYDGAFVILSLMANYMSLVIVWIIIYCVCVR